MTYIGIPIPQGFTVTTEACTLYYDSDKKIPDFVVEQIKGAIKDLEKLPERISVAIITHF